MTARWDKLPPKAKVKKPRRPVDRGTWLCDACDTLITGTWASVERHVDELHGGARVSIVLDPERAKVISPTEGDADGTR